METKHSPLPWQAEETSITCPSENYDLIAEAFSPLDQSVEPEANISFIVRACNNHFKLIEALKELQQVAIDYDLSGANSIHHPIWVKVANTLAEAEAK